VLDKIEGFVCEQIEAHGSAPHVVLVPAIKDVHHRPVYPQPPFAARLEAAARPYIHFAPNPATLDVGGVRFGCCTLDVLMMLTQQEIARAPPPADGAPPPHRLSRLASHVLRQRLFLPLCPPPTDATGASLPVDLVASFERGAIASRPDVMLMPSDLAPFAKTVDGGVLALNAGRLTRKQAGGSFAFISIHPTPAADGPSEPATSVLAPTAGRGVAERAFVEVVRI